MNGSKTLNEHPKDLLPDYVLGLLELEEVEVIEAHLALCAECQEEAWSLAEPLVVLNEAWLDAPNDAPPEHILQAIKTELASADAPLLPEIARIETSSDVEAETRQVDAREVDPSPPPLYRRYAWPLTAAVALVLALSSTLWGVNSYRTLQSVNADERLLSAYLANPQVQKVVLENVLASDRTEPIGSALFTSRSSQASTQPDVLFVLNENAPRGRAYQAWGHTSSDWNPERGETLESLRVSQNGVFEVDGSGFASLYLSLEPAGGSPQPTKALSKVSLLNPVAAAPLEITTPEDGAQVSSPSLIVSGVTEPSVTNLRYTLNSGEPTQSAAANNRFSFTVSGLQEGENTVEVRAETTNGATVSASVRVTYTP